MENSDVRWAQKVIDRWAIKKAVLAPRVTTISTMEEKILSGYQNNTVILYERAWDKQDLLGKILLLANPFGYHIQCVLGQKPDDDKAWELATELVLLEIELLATATGVEMTQLMRMKKINDLDDFAGGAAHKKGMELPDFWRRF